MTTYKIYPLDNYSQFKYLNDLLLTADQKNKGKHVWCFKHKKHYLDQLTYECERGSVEDAFLNLYANKELTRQCYYGVLSNPIAITLDMYNTIKSQQIKNRCFWYAIKIYNDDVHTNTVFIMAINDGSYYYTYGNKIHDDGWPKEIPEEYKSQIIYKEMVPFIADELNDSNIQCDVNGTIFVEGLPINEHGYYIDKYMYHLVESNSPKDETMLYIYTPFNVLNLKYCINQINQYVSKYAPRLNIRVIGNNSQLSNITNIRIGGVDINENILKLFKTQQSNIIRNKSRVV